jgi:SPP1 family predicted phage head-tail adaptor
MMYKDVVYLLEMGLVKEGRVETEKEISRTMVFADVKSVSMQEFYAASQNGFSPTLNIEIRTVDYRNDEEQLEHNGKKYNIIRIYTKGDITELKCERLGGSK